MANTTDSQYMDLPIPVPTVQTGPQYANDVNQCLTLIDQHNHAPGYGNLIPSNGINLNADLPFNSFNATGLRSARFTVQGSLLSAATDIGCIYVSGSDLYYRDISGNNVRMTASGAVAGTPGSIGNLVSPANVTYNSGNQTYIFQSTTATAGNLDAASIVIRNPTANANGITLSAPPALSSNYSLSLFPTLPSSGSTKIVTVDGGGNLGDTYDVDQSTLTVTASLLQIKSHGVAQGLLALRPTSSAASAGQIAIGTNLNTSFTGTNWEFFTNGSVPIITTGRPVKVGLIPTIGASTSFGSSINGAGISNSTFELRWTLDGNPISPGFLLEGGVHFSPNVINAIDFPSAGAHTYALQGNINTCALIFLTQVSICAYEI